MSAPTGVVVLTDRRQAVRGGLVEVVRRAVAGGVRWVVLREKDLPRSERAALAASLRHVLADVGGRLIVAGPDPLGGDAVQLAAADPYPSTDVSLVGRSCHGTAELDRLSTEDYVTLSPVFASRSKPGYGPRLLPYLGELVRRTPVPVLALGGVETPRRAAACMAADAAGVAVMGAVMRAADPARVAAALSRACATKSVVPVRSLGQAGASQKRGGST